MKLHETVRLRRTGVLGFSIAIAIAIATETLNLHTYSLTLKPLGSDFPISIAITTASWGQLRPTCLTATLISITYHLSPITSLFFGST